MKLISTKAEDIVVVKYLSFRKEDPSKSNRTYMALRSIAKFLGKSTAYVHKIT